MGSWIKRYELKQDLQKKRKRGKKRVALVQPEGIELGSAGQGSREQSHWAGSVLVSSYIVDGTKGSRNG